MRPTLTDTRGETLFLSTPKGYNHFYDLFELAKTDPDFKSFHFTTYDKPYIPADEIEAARRQLTEDRFAQEYMADFRKLHGLRSLRRRTSSTPTRPNPTASRRWGAMASTAATYRRTSKLASRRQELLRAGRIRVHNSCVNTIAEFESYAYPAKKADHNEPELPIKENDHAMDALRYALFMNSHSGTGAMPSPTIGLVRPFPGQRLLRAARSIRIALT